MRLAICCFFFFKLGNAFRFRLSPHARQCSTGQCVIKWPCFSAPVHPLDRNGVRKQERTYTSLRDVCGDRLRSTSPLLRIWSVVCSTVMAIYHMHATIISRASGASAVAAAAYRSGENLIDERDGRSARLLAGATAFDGAEIIAPEGAPDWVHDREKLWNAGEDAEKRKDSQVAREVRVCAASRAGPGAAAGAGAGVCEGRVCLARDGRGRVLSRWETAATRMPISC